MLSKFINPTERGGGGGTAIDRSFFKNIKRHVLIVVHIIFSSNKIFEKFKSIDQKGGG